MPKPDTMTPGPSGPSRPAFVKDAHLTYFDSKIKGAGVTEALLATAELCESDPDLKPGEAALAYVYWESIKGGRKG